VNIDQPRRRRKFIANDWEGRQYPASQEAALTLLQTQAQVLRAMPADEFPARFRYFAEWIMGIGEQILLPDSIREGLVFAARGREGSRDLLLEVGLKPQAPMMNGHHPEVEPPSAPTTTQGKAQVAKRDLFGAFWEGEGSSAPVPALIKGLLPRDGVCVLGGQSGAGKSYLAVHLAICLATAAPFFGYRTRHKSAILYAAAEGAATIQPRINAAKKLANIDQRLPIKIFTRLRFPGAAEKPEKEGQLTPLEQYIGALKVEVADLRERSGEDHVTMIVDTTMAAFEIRDENSSGEIAAICHSARRLAEECGALVILVHHFGKDPSRGLRGSSAWRDNIDHGFFLLAERSEATNEVKDRNLNFLKNRVGNEGPIAGFKLENVPMGIDEDGEPWSEAGVRMADYVVISAKTAPKKKERDRVFDEAFAWAIKGAKPRPVGGDGPNMVMVELSKVREQFSSRYATGEDGELRQKTAIRKAFSDAMKVVRKDPKYAFDRLGSAEFVFRTDQATVSAFEMASLTRHDEENQ
jgi:hypothetical protein